MSGGRTISFDLDGVLARPPLGINLTIDRDVGRQPRPAPPPTAAGPRATLWDRALRRSYYKLRYLGRPPLTGAREALQAARADGRVLVLTGRNWRGRAQTERWLRRNALWDLVDDLLMNDGHSSSARFKERVLARTEVACHVDDDAATAALLARRGINVALIDWPRNRALSFPEGVTRYPDLQALAAALAPRL